MDGKIISPVAVIISDLMMGDEEDEMDDMETCLYEIYALAGWALCTLEWSLGSFSLWKNVHNLCKQYTKILVAMSDG